MSFLNSISQPPLEFEECYHCYSMAVSGRDLEDGDKILLPQSALAVLARLSLLLFFYSSLICSLFWRLFSNSFSLTFSIFFLE